MPRPRRCRWVESEPGVCSFKPVGRRICDLEESVLTVDEFEAIRLKDLERLEQEEAAKRMGISQPTFNRILNSARGKISDALVNCKLIKIEGGDYKMVGRRLKCFDCGNEFEEPLGTPRPGKCPKCGSSNIHRMDKGPRGRGRGRCGRGKGGHRQV